jgi:hypothetical protein
MGVVKVVFGGRLEILVPTRRCGERKEFIGNRRKNRSAHSTTGKLPKKSPVDLIERHVVEASGREGDKVCECYELLQYLQFT